MVGASTGACGLSNCTVRSGWPSRSGCLSRQPSNGSFTLTAADGIIALGQSRRATSQTVTGTPCGSDRSATKIGSHSTCGLAWARWTSSARLIPTAAAAPATKAAINTVAERGRWRRGGTGSCSAAMNGGPSCAEGRRVPTVVQEGIRLKPLPLARIRPATASLLPGFRRPPDSPRPLAVSLALGCRAEVAGLFSG